MYRLKPKPHHLHKWWGFGFSQSGGCLLCLSLRAKRGNPVFGIHGLLRVLAMTTQNSIAITRSVSLESQSGVLRSLGRGGARRHL